jgi:hypothetical protein
MTPALIRVSMPALLECVRFVDDIDGTGFTQ